MGKFLGRLVKANPLGLFVYGIISKWYLIITFAGVVVVYWVFHGLNKTGVLNEVLVIVESAVVDAKSIAQNCTPRIRDLGDFWRCIENTPKYRESSQERSIMDMLNRAVTSDSTEHNYIQNPYTE
jgi:hypothetical protein